MFSAASFYDVLRAGRLPGEAGEPVGPLQRPAVVAFYGFRGGAGRTTALANTAHLLAKDGLRVGALDLDLEAPGLNVALGVSVPPKAGGISSLVRKALREPTDALVGVAKEVVAVPSFEGRGRILVLPAGAVTPEYLADIEELGLNLWHVGEGPAPLTRIINEFHATSDLDIVLVDCRTGFSGLSASVVFHVADYAVVLFPLSEQVWDGLGVLLDATRVARSHRKGRPGLLLVPSMVPPGEAGRLRLAKYLPRIAKLYSERVGLPSVREDDVEDPDEPPEPWLQDGLPYEPAIAASDVPGGYSALASVIFGPLVSAVREAAGLDAASELSQSDLLDAAGIIKEIKIDRGLAFGEYPPLHELIERFVAPTDIAGAIDRTNSLVIGAKGAGKTWLWRYLVGSGGKGAYRLPEGMAFLEAHGPKGAPEAWKLQLSPDGFKELERTARMRQNETHKAFWRLYALVRLATWRPSIIDAVLGVAHGAEKAVMKALFAAASPRELGVALRELLVLPNVGTLAEEALAEADKSLMLSDVTATLVYDGLDTGFEIGASVTDNASRRERFVAALLQVLLEARSQLRRAHFKVFLREDMFLEVKIQNKSHLEATKHELRWRPADLWRIALNIVASSEKYRDVLRRTHPGVSEPWPADEDTLKTLLSPFWGERIEKGKTARTANYIQKRTSDAKDRVFPRTLVQLLDAAIKSERALEPAAAPTRVLRFASLRKGILVASKQRVEDLQKEYAELTPYLGALKGMAVTGTRKDFVRHLSTALSRRSSAATRTGLHKGPGGWQKVIDRLIDVGVLGSYLRGTAESDSEKLAVALLYRTGLDLRLTGLA